MFLAGCGGTGGGTPPEAHLVGVTVSPAGPSIAKGTTQQFTATGRFSDGTTEDLTSRVLWSAANPTVATITAAGLATGLAAGTTMVSATSQTFSGAASLTVGPPALVSIAVVPSAISMAKGQSQQFTATGTYTDGTSQAITTSVAWSSANTGIAAVAITGVVTALSAGSTSVTATQSGISASSSITVNPAALVSLAVTPGTATIAKGLTQQFTATGSYTDGSTQNLTSSVTWATSNAGAASVNSSGLATGLAQGAASISAAQGSISAMASLTVNPAALLSIAVAPGTASIAKGLSQQFTATGTYSDGTTQSLTSSVTWTSSNPAVASIAPSGLASALTQGTASIQAALSGISSSSSLAVTPAALLSIAVTPGTTALPKGLTQQFAATGSYTDGSTQNLTAAAVWTSSNIAVATIPPGGLATAVGVGGATIAASSGTITGSAALTVTPPDLVAIAVTPVSPSIAKGLTQQFTATGTYTDNSTQNLTASATWTSSNAAVASIAPGGLATTVEAGTAVVSALSGTVTGSTSLTVTAATLVSIAVTPANPSIMLNGTQQFTATGTYTDNSTQDLTTTATWSATNTAIATISNAPGSNGLATSASVGMTAIQATDPVTGISGSTELTVTSNGIVTVTISPRQAGLTLTQPQQFTATVQNTGNTAVTWSVDGVVGGNSVTGLVTTAGLYTPPSLSGTHMVTATSVADPTASATATVYVSDYAGMTTYRNDLTGTAQNLDEIALTSATVNTNTFGKLFSCPVDGFLYTQPLYVANFNINGATHNVIFVATENDTVYAFDADSSACQILWQTSFLISGATPIPSSDVSAGNCMEIVPQIGISGTPAIDLANNTLFLVAGTLEGPSNLSASYVWRLHAISLTTGLEQPGSPTVIAATITNSGGGSVVFNGQQQKSRTALRLVNGILYFGFGSNCDSQPYYGWVFAYNEFTLSQLVVYNTTANGSGGGVWMAGGGFTMDSSNNLYLATGNGTFDADTGLGDYGDSVLKLAIIGNTLSEVDYFTPYNQADLDANNLDLGSGTPMLLPDQPGAFPHLAVMIGKGGTLYLLNRDNLGQYNSTADQVVQELNGPLVKSYGTLAYWNYNIYVAGVSDYLKAFQLSNGLLSTSWTSISASKYQFPGSMGTVSSASSVSPAAIFWILNNGGFGANGANPSPAVLHAYDATNVANELYNSSLAGTRDTAENAVKFTVPTIANGKVYFGTQTALDVYGLLP